MNSSRLTCPGDRRFERHDFHQRLAGLGDNERLVLYGALDQPRKIGFGLVDVDDRISSV